jgi:hypothetical protein
MKLVGKIFFTMLQRYDKQAVLRIVHCMKESKPNDHKRALKRPMLKL